jgi:hypothetical protein
MAEGPKLAEYQPGLDQPLSYLASRERIVFSAICSRRNTSAAANRTDDTTSYFNRETKLVLTIALPMF